MERITVRLPTPEGVTAGGTALAKLPTGRAYHLIYISYTGVTLAQMTEIRIKANGKVIHRYSAVERDAMNQFTGMAAANGVLTIPFDRRNLKLRPAEEETCVNTGQFAGQPQLQAITSFELEIDIDAAATNPKIELDSVQSAQREGGIGAILHCVPFTRSSAGAGELQISDIPFKGITSPLLSRVFIKTANTTKLKVEKDTYVVFERKKALNELIQADGVRVPQTGYFVMDTTELGYGGAQIDLRGVNDFRYVLEMSGAEQIKIWPEYMGLLGQ